MVRRAPARLSALARVAVLVLLLVVSYRVGEGVAPGSEKHRQDGAVPEASLASGANPVDENPLLAYERYEALTGDLDAADEDAIADFLERFADTPLAPRLRSAYLPRLAAAGRWSDYARLYRPDDASNTGRCFYLRALLETGQRDSALGQVEPLWLIGRSQPAACDPVFDDWIEAGGLTEALIWERIRLAMAAGSSRLVVYLGGLLSDPERVWLDRWLALGQDPAFVLDPVWRTAPHPQRPAMLSDGISRLARGAGLGAAAALDQLEDLLAADPTALSAARNAVARALTRVGDRHALDYWDRLYATPENLDAQEDRLRAAIRFGDWERVDAWIALMPEGEAKRDRWLYWQARAQAALGRDADSRASYARAAEQRSFWGFLAADRIGRPYHLSDLVAPAKPELVERIAGSAAVTRILQLRRLGREADMRREWLFLTKDMDEAELMAAARVAQALSWHDQAVFTLARTGYWDDLRLRFPLAYRELVAEQSWQTGLAPDWIFAVIRQESVFARTIASPAGALGLMQLMPRTASEVAVQLGLDPPSRPTLLDPAVNIALGSSYLAAMRDRFGHPALATAAYNAGPHRVARWLPEECTDADLWIVAIPFSETRGYVERVLAYRVIYRARLGLPTLRLASLLGPVPAESFFRTPAQPESAGDLAVAAPR